MQETIYEIGTPCRIAFLTDNHNGPNGEIFASLDRNGPDIICIAGDIIHGNRRSTLYKQKNSIELIKKCARTAPTFMSVGNHEWPLDAADLDVVREMGINVLDNEWTVYDGMVIGGLTSELTQSSRICRARGEKFRYLELTDEYNGFLDEFERQQGYKLLLCHHPEYYDKYFPGRDIDLILSGHAHGGQWRVFGRGIFSPGQGFLPKLTSGIHNNMIISRGLAPSGLIPRINNSTEIVYIR